MIATTSDHLVTLRERRRQLSDRLDDVRAEQRDIVEDLAVARTDWADAVEIGENADLLAERVHLRERELADRGHAAEHLGTLLADLDAKIADTLARQALAADALAYHEACIDHNATIPDLVDALGDVVAVIGAALGELIGEVDTARDSHDRLTGTAAQLRQRAEILGTDVDAPEPKSWTVAMENAHPKDSPGRTLMLAVIQGRGAHAILGEIEHLIQLDLAAKRKALR
jgi:chromosome segregation ATPase